MNFISKLKHLAIKYQDWHNIHVYNDPVLFAYKRWKNFNDEEILVIRQSLDWLVVYSTPYDKESIPILKQELDLVLKTRKVSCS